MRTFRSEHYVNNIYDHHLKNYTHHHNDGDNKAVQFIVTNAFIIIFLLFCIICVLTQVRRSRGDPYTDPTEEEINDTETCPICLEELDGIEETYKIKICSHILCKSCGTRLLDLNIHSCPVCRRHFYNSENR